MVRLSLVGHRSLEEHLDRLEKDPSMPPFIFGVTTSRREIYHRGTGFRDADNPASGNVDAETAAWICSEGKLITHLAALQLVESGHLSPDTLVSHYFPEFQSCVIVADGSGSSILEPPISESLIPKPSFHPARQAMTVEHLMHHTSGLFYSGQKTQDWGKDLDNPYVLPHDANDPVGAFLRSIMGDFPGIPLKFEPGTDWAYGWSTDILGFIVEKVSGMSLEEYMQRNIFQPLSMTRTSFYRTPRINENVMSVSHRPKCSPTFERWDHRFYEVDPDKVHLFCGGAHLISTSGDYLKFLRHLLQIHAGIIEPPAAIVSRSTVLKLFAPSLDETGQQAIQAFLGPTVPASTTPSVQWANGQAVTITDWEDRRRSGSGFWMGFLNLRYWIDPKTGVAAVLHGQFLPPLDDSFVTLCEELERILYAGLEDDGQ